MKRLAPGERNILNLVDGRTLDAGQALYPNEERNTMRALQMHSSLVRRLQLEKQLEGHLGCVNTLAWNSTGSLLVSGSDDTRANIWDYDTQKLRHSIDTGHTANIFCTKFLPETGDDLVVSGAGDCEVRAHRVSRSGHSGTVPAQSAFFRCHSKRVKKLAVEDGNPHVVWSASEDGTLRQHDLRETSLCDAECRNILLDLRNSGKKSLADPPRQAFALKTCAINSMRPHQILVGGSDAFARLYDRRMLPPLSSSLRPPACVCYYCPVHLSDYSRPTLHLTHVTFSPNGDEVLLSYSGEHVYLMDAFNGQSSSTAYVASEAQSRMSLVPLSDTPKPSASSSKRMEASSAQLEESRRLLDEARKSLRADNYLHAIEFASDVIDGDGPAADPVCRHDCLIVRAEAFMKRGWKNDLHMTIRDCNEARRIDPTSVEAHRTMAEALSQLGKHEEALEFASRAFSLDSLNGELSSYVVQLRSRLAEAENVKNNKSKEGENKSRNSRIRSLREFFFIPDQELSDSSDESRRVERDDSDIDDDMEMEMEIEMSVPDVTQPDQEPRGGSSSLNLRLRRRSDFRRVSPVASSTNDTSTQEEFAMDMRQRYVGHCNTGTDIKQASFLGERGQFVASGSDDGRWFIWEKKTGRLVKVLLGDENVVNCVQCHPFDCTVATSGIDSTIKLWTPRSKSPRSEEGPVSVPEAVRIMSDNQRAMRRHREIGFFLIAEAWSIFARRFEFMQENADRTAAAN